MAWYRTGTTVPTFRRSISLDSTAGAAAADAAFTIPPTLAEFWSEIDASGNELRVCDSDGYTLLTYQLAAGFNATTRTGTIQIDNIAASVAGVRQLWLYYGMDGVSSGAGSFVYSASKSAQVYMGAPLASPPPIRWAPQRPADTTPRESRTKAVDEVIWLTFDFGDALQPLLGSGDNQTQFEELADITYAVTEAGVTQAGMISASSVRVIDGRYVQVLVQGGTDGEDYTVSVLARTTYPNGQTGRTLDARCLLVVQDVQDT
jgi:hypothetical protein